MSGFLRRTKALAAKEIRQVLRDPRSLYLALGMPVIMILLFGFGVRFDLDRLNIAFVDLDRSQTTREIRRRLIGGGEFVDVGTVDLQDAESVLVAGQAIAVVVFEPDLERNLLRGDETRIQVLIDGSDNNSATQTRQKLETMAALFARQRALGDGRRVAPMISVLPWTRFNPQARSAVFLVPGIAAYVLAIIAVLLTALTVAREWERGSMLQLFATPVGRLEIVLGKLTPYLALGGIAVLLVIAIGTWVFDVPFRGSSLALAVLSFLFLAGMLGQGLLISVVTRNQMVATQVATMTSMLPSLLLSGFIFPIENMPTVLRMVTVIIPARYYVEGLRGVLLRGNGLQTLWPEAVALLAFAVVMIVVSTARFRRTIA